MVPDRLALLYQTKWVKYTLLGGLGHCIRQTGSIIPDKVDQLHSTRRTGSLYQTDGLYYTRQSGSITLYKANWVIVPDRLAQW